MRGQFITFEGGEGAGKNLLPERTPFATVSPWGFPWGFAGKSDQLDDLFADIAAFEKAHKGPRSVL